MLPQRDGSHSAWLQEGALKSVLPVAEDDVNSAVVNAVLRSIEDAPGCVTMLDVVTEDRGIPFAPYSERHALFKHHARRLEPHRKPPSSSDHCRNWGFGGYSAVDRGLRPTGERQEGRRASTVFTGSRVYFPRLVLAHMLTPMAGTIWLL